MVCSVLKGLSPLARGNLLCDVFRDVFLGPIPARAGEPFGSTGGSSPSRAYPRSRGGTVCAISERCPPRGLSPLARGNHGEIREPAARLRPIPARAGEPRSALRSPQPKRAYPRSRGGTERRIASPAGCKGLSPLARGNLDKSHKLLVELRPIPARAGEPFNWLASFCCARAYPRSRGGTDSARAPGRTLWGLSPLARGNPIQQRLARGRPGPIPARAGEPQAAIRAVTPSGAYPRSRGGTAFPRGADVQPQGLSPLARGNRRHRACQVRRFGPIPARAGEPSMPGLRGTGSWAYPRSRGGTGERHHPRRYGQGLSPLARGNLFQFLQRGVIGGPIPARAGEPMYGVCQAVD